MIEVLTRREVWLYLPVLDFRKQLDGLIQIVASQMNKAPNDGSVFVFRNRSKDKLKILLWDRNGFWLLYKRLETGRFDVPEDEAGEVRLNWEQMYLLISGLPMSKLAVLPNEKVTAFF
jgi:transposase